MATKRSKPLSKLSRTRSGCLTCRDRHMKCDEQQPVCKNCIKSKRKCYRGIRLNFTQYNIFRPESELPVCSSYRFLDQSLTIASLYRNGTESYFPYLKLHNPKDLEESDLKYQEDLYASSTSSSYLPVGQVEIPKRNEGTDLLGFNRWQPISERNSILGQGILKSLVDREKRIQKDMTADVTNDVTTKFLKLVEIEEYYWLLDLFNELGVWKSIVPNYCINTLNDGDEFLTKCLLNCSRNSDYDLNGIIQEQSSLLESFKFQDVTPENEKKFKNLLISVVLILLNFNIKISGSLITLTDFHKSLLNDQAKIFDILMKKLTLNGWKMAKSAVLFSSIQSVVILKYFITKQFESKGLLNGIKEGWINQTQQLLNNSNHDISILSDFITFTSFELSHLQDSFSTLDFPQVDGVNSLEPDSNYVSDSLKLRRVMWQLIRCNFAVEHPEKDTFRLSLDEEYENLKAEMSNSIDSDHSWVTFTNERLVAANILRDMVMKIIKNNDRELVATANREIHHIFFAIKDSSQHPNGKSHWENNFNWTVKIIR